MNRKVLLFWAVLVVGVALIVMPFAIGLPGKASAGQRMIDNFRPIMQPAQVEKTAYFYNDVFVPLGKVTPALSAENVAKLQQALSVPALMQAMRANPQLAQQFGGLMSMMQANTGIFAQVPAGLAHYEPLVTTMQGNVDNYAQIDALPNFRLFTWFFVAPGALLVLLAGWGLLEGRAFSLPIHLGHRPIPH